MLTSFNKILHFYIAFIVYNDLQYFCYNRYFASSKTCSECGYQLSNLDLSIREWTCPDCEVTHDRDINAAQNILQRGIFEESLKMGSCKTYLKKSDTEN